MLPCLHCYHYPSCYEIINGQLQRLFQWNTLITATVWATLATSLTGQQIFSQCDIIVIITEQLL